MEHRPEPKTPKDGLDRLASAAQLFGSDSTKVWGNRNASTGPQSRQGSLHWLKRRRVRRVVRPSVRPVSSLADFREFGRPKCHRYDSTYGNTARRCGNCKATAGQQPLERIHQT